MVVVFTVNLTVVLYYRFLFSSTTQDSILDAHEKYYYSQMVLNWGENPDTNIVKKEIENLHMWCGIFNRDSTEFGIPYPGSPYWSNLPSFIEVDNFISWTNSQEYEELYDMEIPLSVFFGSINEMSVTVVDDGKNLFYFVIDYVWPSELNNLIFVFILAILFIIGLYLFIRKYLKPVELMKKRIEDLENGDLTSKIDVIGEDELADLSISMNKLIKDINILLENKHQLLLEVSHELRSPLARMQLLIAMMPEHKNLSKMKNEIDFLEGMIANLLLSDRLSLPYSKLDLQTFETDEIIKQVLDMFPNHREKLRINNNIPHELINIDKTKFLLALRNLLDNAIKYSQNLENNDFYIEIEVNKNKYIQFKVKDFGIGISKENIQNLTEPFFQADETVSTKGFGLGLTICKKIIESHNGFLSIESKVGSGSTFILHLPIV